MYLTRNPNFNVSRMCYDVPYLNTLIVKYIGAFHFTIVTNCFVTLNPAPIHQEITKVQGKKAYGKMFKSKKPTFNKLLELKLKTKTCQTNKIK